jgi:hypothetical protein
MLVHTGSGTTVAAPAAGTARAAVAGSVDLTLGTALDSTNVRVDIADIAAAGAAWATGTAVAASATARTGTALTAVAALAALAAISGNIDLTLNTVLGSKNVRVDVANIPATSTTGTASTAVAARSTAVAATATAVAAVATLAALTGDIDLALDTLLRRKVVNVEIEKIAAALPTSATGSTSSAVAAACFTTFAAVAAVATFAALTGDIDLTLDTVLVSLVDVEIENIAATFAAGAACTAVTTVAASFATFAGVAAVATFAAVTGNIDLLLETYLGPFVDVEIENIAAALTTGTTKTAVAAGT